MSTVEKFPQGAPAWVDLQSPDPEASKAFYAGLFGWQYTDSTSSAQGSYATATIGGVPVAAIAGQTTEAVEAGVPTAWNTYFAVDDLDATLEKVIPAGGLVVMPATDVSGSGRMAAIEDGVGTPLLLWESGQHTGAGLINEPGTIVWHELAADNWDHAVPFYLAVLGGEAHEEQVDGGTFTMLKAAGMYVAGFKEPETEDRSPRWEVYFGTEDADAAVVIAQKGGGTVLREPVDIPGVGRIAMLQDPHGAIFWVLQEPAVEG
jgi:predicted enzyme related to lactoylglutathione lyase